MKKFVYFTLLASSLGLNLYLLNTEVVVHNTLEDDIIEIDDEISVAQSALKISKMKNKSHQKNLKQIRKGFVPSETQRKESEAEVSVEKEKRPQDYERDYEKAKEAWREKLSRYMEYELGLQSEQVERYFELGNERESAISNYLSPKMGKNAGEAYFFTIEDNVAMGKINEKYLNLLRQELGEDSYRQYIQYRQTHNRKAIEAGNADFYMDF